MTTSAEEAETTRAAREPTAAGPTAGTGQGPAAGVDWDGLRAHLVDTGLAGAVATSPRSTLTNCARAARDHPDYAFGLGGGRRHGVRGFVDAVDVLCGGDPGGSADLDGPGFIDPDATLDGIARHREVFAATAAAGARVLLATGHPTGLLAHYAALSRALAAAGCEVLAPLDDTWVTQTESNARRGIRFTDRVGCVFDGASLRHTHRAEYAEAMLAALARARRPPELVVGDHGMAGAAIARGIPTLSIADVNDPALPRAQCDGRTDGVLVIDDNLAPATFAPVTEAMVAAVGEGSA